MRAKQDPAQPFAGQKARRGALDSQAFDQLPPLAFEFVGGKGSLLRELRDEPQQIVRKIHQAGEGNHAGIGAGSGRQVRAHAAQILFDLAAGARRGASAHHGCGHIRESRRSRRRDGVAAAEEKLPGEFRDRVRFHEHDFEAVRKRRARARRPNDRPFGRERGNSP